MGRKNGEDVSGLEAELKEKFAKLNEVGCKVEYSVFFTHSQDMSFGQSQNWMWVQLIVGVVINGQI